MDEGQIRKIIHIDMDAFYASVEQRDGPTLKGKPVAVGYPAKTRRRCSGELRDRSFAVRSAMPSNRRDSEVRRARVCPTKIRSVPRNLQTDSCDLTNEEKEGDRHRERNGPFCDLEPYGAHARCPPS